MSSNSSKGAIAKTLLYVAVPSLVAGYLWWQTDQRTEQEGAAAENEESTEEFLNQNSKEKLQPQTETIIDDKQREVLAVDEQDQSNNQIDEENKDIGNIRFESDEKEKIILPSQYNCGKNSIVLVEVKQAMKGRGRGLFTQKRIKKNEMFLKVRPSLTLLFEPYCKTHCLGCFANLHQIPGRQCDRCDRFAVCRECDLNHGLFDWHINGECIRWNELPKTVTQKTKLDVLWLLTRYRASLEKDIDFNDISHNTNQSSLEKEPLSMLQQLQGNSVDIPQPQLVAFGQLTDLSPAVVKQLIMQLRTNAGSICEGTVKIGMALSGHLGFFNHSCAPNSCAKVEFGYLEVTALRELEQGEEVTICYVNDTASVLERQSILQGHYQFTCDCQRCQLELRNLSMMSPSSNLADSVEWEKIEKPMSPLYAPKLSTDST